MNSNVWPFFYFLLWLSKRSTATVPPCGRLGAQPSRTMRNYLDPKANESLPIADTIVFFYYTASVNIQYPFHRLGVLQINLQCHDINGKICKAQISSELSAIQCCSVNLLCQNAREGTMAAIWLLYEMILFKSSKKLLQLCDPSVFQNMFPL